MKRTVSIGPVPRRLSCRTLALALPCSVTLALGGCAQLEGGPLDALVPYRIDLVQGNVVTQDQLDRVRPGQRRAEVRELLGTPLVTDPFHVNRWDYVFSLDRQGSKAQRQVLVLHFDGDVLAKVDAPAKLASEKEFVASISRRTDKVTEPRLSLSDEERKALPAPARTAAAAQEPMGAIRPYPPLEAP